MAHGIFVDGRLLPPEVAVKRLAPLDTELRCPECNHSPVYAGTPKLSARIGLEFVDGVPREQERRCPQCDARWVTILPPELYVQLSTNPLPSR